MLISMMTCTPNSRCYLTKDTLSPSLTASVPHAAFTRVTESITTPWERDTMDAGAEKQGLKARGIWRGLLLSPSWTVSFAAGGYLMGDA